MQIRAMPDGCQLVLVGDPNQLPPVGPGYVLAGLLKLLRRPPASDAAGTASGKAGPEDGLKADAASAASGEARPEDGLKADDPGAASGRAHLLPGVLKVTALDQVQVQDGGNAAASHGEGSDSGGPNGVQPGAAAVVAADRHMVPPLALLPRVHLGEVFRQDGAGAIVSGALQIRDGEDVVWECGSVGKVF